MAKTVLPSSTAVHKKTARNNQRTAREKKQERGNGDSGLWRTNTDQMARYIPS